MRISIKTFRAIGKKARGDMNWKRNERILSSKYNFIRFSRLCSNSIGYKNLGVKSQRTYFRFSAAICMSLMLVGCLLTFLPAYATDWTDEKKSAVTEYMRDFCHEWTGEDTEQLVRGAWKNIKHLEATVIISDRPTDLKLVADDGQRVPVELFGDSILVGGKDISGNLGSKTTHGANSPIIENVRNSQLATGERSTILKDTDINFSITLSLSIALSASLGLNLYLLRKIRSKRRHSSKPDV